MSHVRHTEIILFHPNPQLPIQISDLTIFEFDSIENNRHWAGGFKSLEQMLEDGWVVIGRFDEEVK